MTQRKRLEFPLQEAVSDIRLRPRRREFNEAFDDTTPTPMAFAVSVGPSKPERCGDWIQTATGRQFWPLDPRPEDINLTDIATSLANQCRFAGHLLEGFYSVAQHCVLVALSLPACLRAQGLLHDAAEAYLVDVPRPVKRYLINYDVIEARLAATIGDRFGVELCDLDPIVKLADNRALATEKRDLLVPEPAAWAELPPPWMARIAPWEPAEARKAFLGLAWKLGLK